MIQFRISGLPGTCIMLYELFRTIAVVYFFTSPPFYFSLIYGRTFPLRT